MKLTKAPYEIAEIRVPIEEPDPQTLQKIKIFRLGQADRKAGQPCRSADGDYLDGWYEPEKEIPQYVTRAQVNAFNL